MAHPAHKPCVAGFCVICRDVQPFNLSRVGKPATGVAVIGTCESCGVRLLIAPEDFLEVSPSRPETVRELVERTNPRLPLEIAERIILEKRAAAGELDAPERIQAIREPFQVLAYLAKRDSWLAQTVIASAFVGVTVMLAALGLIDPKGQNQLLSYSSWGPVIKISLLVGPMLLITAAAWAYQTIKRRRKLRSELLPRLARALRPLRPTIDELERTYTWLLTASNPVALVTTPAQVHEQVCREPDRSLVNADDMEILAWAREMHERLAARAEEPSRY